MAKVTITVESHDLGNVRVEAGHDGIAPDRLVDLESQLNTAIAKVRGAYGLKGGNR